MKMRAWMACGSREGASRGCGGLSLAMVQKGSKEGKTYMMYVIEEYRRRRSTGTAMRKFGSCCHFQWRRKPTSQ